MKHLLEFLLYSSVTLILSGIGFNKKTLLTNFFPSRGIFTYLEFLLVYAEYPIYSLSYLNPILEIRREEFLATAQWPASLTFLKFHL